MVAVVHGFKFLWEDGFVGYADGSGVVALDWSGRLRPSHFHECLTHGDEGLGSDVEGT